MAKSEGVEFIRLAMIVLRLATSCSYLSLLAFTVAIPLPVLAWTCESNCEWYQPDCFAWKKVRCINSESTIPVMPPDWGSQCVVVDSRMGWQKFDLGREVNGVQSISGGWSVDRRNYAPVGAAGHMGRDAEALSPYSQYKYNQRYPFGALLLGDGREYRWIQQGSRFAYPLKSIDMRINDADKSLGDNSGSLRVCFR